MTSKTSIARTRNGALALLSALCVAVLAGCEGPTLLMSGGALSGEVRPAPVDWNFANDAGWTVQLETRPEDPYSVNLAYVVLEGRMYVYAGNTETQWVKNIAQNPDVRFRLDGVVYELRARRVSDDATVGAFGDAWVERNRFSTHARDHDEMWLYELVARS